MFAGNGQEAGLWIRFYYFRKQVNDFTILGKTRIISNHKVIVLYLFVLLLVQIVIGKVAYRQLRKNIDRRAAGGVERRILSGAGDTVFEDIAA